ncbi:MAG: N-acetylmuramoyl-L-alanine amidase [Kineosporiaceae bacterium]
MSLPSPAPGPVEPTIQRIALGGAVLSAAAAATPVPDPWPAAPAGSTPTSSADPGGEASGAPAPDAVPSAATPAGGSTATATTPAASGGGTPPPGGGDLTTEPIEVDEFVVLGVTWDAADADPDIQVRVREDGVWSSWQVLERTDEGPDAGTAEYEAAADVAATEPLVTAGADAVQVRVDADPGVGLDDLEAVLIDPGTSPSDDVVERSETLTDAAAVARPGMISRAQWGADESMRRCPAGYSDTIEAATVHHTAGTNSYARTESAGIVRGIYAYHTRTLGWCDIGYNFLVDKYGQVFEGRYGGIELPVRGAHAGGFNDRTFGVAAMGNYSTAAAPAAMVAAIGRVIGWKLALYARGVDGSLTLTSAGGGTSRHAAGTRVAVNRVFGHRDVGLTECPGHNLYARLHEVRAAARSYRASAGGPEGDLFLVSAGGGSGRVEIHAQSRSSAYAARMRSVATGLGSRDPEDWSFFVGSSLGDSRPDLIAVQHDDTASGRVEVEVWSWASNYRERTLDVVTPMSEFPKGSHWAMATMPDSRGRTDLAFITTAGAGGYTEIHRLGAADGYRTWNLHRATGLRRAIPAGDVQWLLDTPGNLYWVLSGASSQSGRTEVHVLSAASNHRLHSLHVATPLGLVPGTTWRFLLNDYNGDQRADLYAVALRGRTNAEVHVLSGAHRYGTFLLHRSTDLPRLSHPAWGPSIG